jgi:outer membrane immunogenic protein
MRTLFSAALIAAATVASPAFAEEKAPFTGPRVEAIIGYDRVNPGEDFDAKSEGLIYGGGIGYDFQLGGAVVGIEGEITGSTGKSRQTGLIAANDVYTQKADRDLYVGGRIGFAVAPSTLLYAKGGYTNAGIITTYTPAGGTTGRSRLEADGYRIGVGVEQKFNLLGPSGYVKAEYRYSNYSKLNSTVSANTAEIDLDRHQAVVGVGVRF